jgi:hypothetical protein
MLDNLQKVVVIGPIDPKVDKTQYVAQEDRGQWTQCGQVRAQRNSQFQHHDGDDDGNYTIAEGFHPIFAHTNPLFQKRQIEDSPCLRFNRDLYFLISDIDVGLTVAEVHTLDNNSLSARVTVEHQAEVGIGNGGVDCALG